MSDTTQEPESISERELADYFANEVFTGQPRSPSEAVAATEAPEELPEAPEEPTPVGEPSIEVADEPVQPVADPLQPPAEPEAEVEEELEPGEVEEEPDDPNVAWATKKYGDDPAQWAKAAYEQEQHISRLAGGKKEAEALAVQWYEYAQEIQQQAQQSQQMGLPLSSSEEGWIEQSLSNPLEYARAAAQQGNVQLYQGVINRIAEENPQVAAQIGTQVQMEMQQIAMQQQAQAQPQAVTLAESLGDSISRLGIDLPTYGERMSAKIGELGEYHPYVQTILEGEPQARDIALMAVYDLVRAGTMTARTVRNEDHEERIRREGELRRQAAGVVTGGPRSPQPPKQSPFMDAMEQEWRDRGQWDGE